MDKPITVEIAETKLKLVTVANEAKVPAWVLRDIFQDLYTQIATIAAQQEEKEAKEWADFQNAEKDKQGDDEHESDHAGRPV